ncbi:MAG: carboxylate--amine ligase, partial [Gammaproteobacteria bacterium]
MSNLLLVVDNLTDIQGVGVDDRVITFEQYLEDHPKKDEKKLSLINLCDSEKYLSRGYYCSLLAEAR